MDLGISESVIYGSRGLEPAYLNPLLPYLIAEHTLGNKDNESLGLDADYRPLKNLRVFGELFIDDLFAPWEIFSDYWGNKLAFTTGFQWIDPFRLSDSELLLEYSRIEPYVYTHQDSINVFENYNTGLGHPLHPNSDLLYCHFRKQFSLAFGMVVFLSSQRHGQGDRWTPHQETDSEKKAFLNGVVEKNRQTGIEFRWEVLRDFFIQVRYSNYQSKNFKQIIDDNRDWNEVVLKANLNW